MIGTFDALKSFFKLDPIQTDNRIFRLHSQFTVACLLACAFLLSIQYIGNPINCTAGDAFDDTYGDIINTYCWITSTYSIPNLIVSDGSAAHPGVGPKQNPFITRRNNTIIRHDPNVKYHKYYQWVVFILIFQALLFYIPKLIWTMSEGGRLSMLVMDMHVFKSDEKHRDWQREVMLKYFERSLNQNNGYFYYFAFCELLNLLNVILQIFLTNRFLGYEFTTYGRQVLDFIDMEPRERNDPMNIIFPKVTKCTFNLFGPSGNIINHDGLCVLQLNIYNEKIYIFLWFWFIILAVISGLALLYRLLTFISVPARVIILKRSSYACNLYDIKKITHRLSVGDWFLLYQLSVNMDGVIYKDFIKDLAHSSKL